MKAVDRVQKDMTQAKGLPVTEESSVAHEDDDAIVFAWEGRSLENNCSFGPAGVHEQSRWRPLAGN